MTDQRHAGGRHTFLGLAAVILGGLLFAAGVMVGRQMGVSQDCSHKEQLDRIDRRDDAPSSIDGGGLTFHKELSRSPKNPKKPAVAAKPEPKPQPKPVVDAKSPPKPKAAQNKIFLLQVASYKDSAQAQQLLTRLKGKGYGAVRVVKGEVPGKGTYFRVRLGPFADREKAQKMQNKLKAGEGLQALVVVDE